MGFLDSFRVVKPFNETIGGQALIKEKHRREKINKTDILAWMHREGQLKRRGGKQQGPSLD